MSLDMVRPKLETEDLLLSITKNCEMLNKQTHRKLEKNIGLSIFRTKRSISFQSTFIQLRILDVRINRF